MKIDLSNDITIVPFAMRIWAACSPPRNLEKNVQFDVKRSTLKKLYDIKNSIFQYFYAKRGAFLRIFTL